MFGYGDLFKYKKNGIFLDIGAHDGININNTYILEKNLGWKGICIEPDPFHFSLLDQNRDCYKENVAITNYTGTINFTPCSPHGYGGEVTTNSGINIPCTTIESVLKKYNIPKTIDYMSIDIEGHELIALEKFPFDTHICLAITIEHNLYLHGPAQKLKIQEVLFSNGYTLIVDNVQSDGLAFEDWYTHKSFKDHVK